jgi:uncharacterized protein
MRLRPSRKLFAIFLFYLFLVAMIAVASPLAGDYSIFLYPLMILASLLLILSFNLKVKIGGFLVGAVAAAAAMGLVMAILVFTGAVSIGQLQNNSAYLLVFGLLLQFLVGFGEELPFRATIFQGLDEELGPVLALVLSAGGFALLHIPSMEDLGVAWPVSLVALGTIFMAGIALALLYAYGGIFNAVAFHITWNFIEYNVFNMGPLGGAINVSRNAPDIFTGGAFGPEASLAGLFVSVLLTIGLWLYYSRVKKMKLSSKAHKDY